MPQSRPGGELRHVKPAKYIEDKAAGLVEIVKIGEKFVINKKRFNPHTGEEVDSAMVDVAIEQLEKRKESLLSQVENIDGMIADMGEL